jgi:MarR family transcriptional regulator for hemolysin
MSENQLSPARAAFGRTLVRVARAWRREADEALAECGLSEAKAVPLTVLARSGGEARLGVLAGLLGIEGPSLLRLVDLLERDGLLVRRADPTDRRAKLIRLTARGRDLAARAEEVLSGVRRRLLNGIAEPEVEIALAVMRSVERGLDGGPGEPESSA